jgi:hypothetical protein
MVEIRRYTAVAADESRSIVLMLGANSDLIPVNAGPSYTAKEDTRRIRGAWAYVLRAGAVIPGVVVSLVTLTGNSGDMWLMELGKAVQGAGILAEIASCDYKVKYNIGVLLIAGALLTGDVVQIGAIYD